MGILNKFIFVILFYILLEMNWFVVIIMIMINKFIIKEIFINFKYKI